MGLVKPLGKILYKSPIRLGVPLTSQYLQSIGGLYYAPFMKEFGPNTWTRGREWVTPSTTETVSGNGTRIGPVSRLIEQAHTNVLRIERNGARLGAARTNLIIQAEDVDTTWTQSGVATSVNSNVAPDGNTTADTITDDNAAGFDTLDQAISIVSGTTTYVASVYIRKDSDETRFPELNVRVQTGGTIRSAFIGLNTATGAIAERSGSAAADFYVVDAGDYWRLVAVLTDNDTGNTEIRFRLYPAIGTSLAVVDSGATGSIVVWGMQLEIGTFASSYIPTTTGTVTRAADDLDYIINNEGIVKSVAGSFGALVTTDYAGANVGVDAYAFDFTTANDGLLGFFDQSNSGKFTVIVTSGGGTIATLVAAAAPVLGTSVYYIITWKNGQFRLMANGVLDAEVTTGAPPVAVGTHVFLGQTRSNGNQLGGNLAHVLSTDRPVTQGLAFQLSDHFLAVTP